MKVEEADRIILTRLQQAFHQASLLGELLDDYVEENRRLRTRVDDLIQRIACSRAQKGE